MARNRRDIDPGALDLPQKRRRTRQRAKAEPGKTLAAEKPKALARALKRPPAPGVMFEPLPDDGYQGTSPHNDMTLWELQIADAFGTRSQAAMHCFLDQLKALCATAWDKEAERWKPDEIELNAALALINSTRPRNEAEAALAAQMVAIHLMQMRMSAQALNNGGMMMERDAALASKLARTYAMQMETLLSVQGKRRSVRQTIKVTRENHVHYHDHRGAARNERQCDATNGAGQPAQRPALPGPHETGRVVSLPSRSREAGMPDARRHKPGRTEG